MTSHDFANQPRRKRRIRWLVRMACLAAAVLLLLPWTPASGLAYLVPSLSPLVATASVVSTRSLDHLALLGLVVAVIVLVRRRWFCRWVCPTGLLADMATRVGRRGGRGCPRLPAMGPWLALLTLGGALLGYPMLLWLDPLALLSGSASILTDGFGPAVWLSVTGMVALLLMSAIWPAIWCHRVCPLGATQDLLAQISGIARQSVQPDDRPGSAVARSGMSRRVVLGTVAGIGWASIARAVIGGERHRIRPPGALTEIEFVGLCVRCGSCTRVCPTNIIHADISPQGVAGLLAPVVEFDRDYCREDCIRCTDVCPSGALSRLGVKDKISAGIGLARVDMDACLLAENRECAACRNNCPFEAITYVWSDIEYMLTPHIDPTRCPGCGACEVACPTTPAKAIVVVPHMR